MPDRPSIRPEQLIEGLLKTIPSGFYVVENRIIIGVNDYILELSGYAREELIGQSARIFFLSDAIFDQVGTEVSRQLSEADKASGEIRWRRKDGTIRHVLLFTAKVDRKDLSGTVIVSVVDITDRKQAEERFSQTFDANPAALIISEIDTGNIVDINYRTEELLGWSRDEMIGRTTLELGIWTSGESRETFIRKFQIDKFLHDEPVQLRTRSGEIRHFRWSAHTLEVDNREVILSSVLDETDRVRAEATLAKRTRWFIATLVLAIVLLLTLISILIHVLRQRNRALVQVAESNTLLQSVLDTIPIRVFWKDRQLRYLGCNASFARDAGKPTPEALIGHDDYDMGWRDQVELYRSDDRHVLESNVPRLNYEESQTTPDGGTLHLRTSKIPLTNAVGDTIGVLGTYENITAMKQIQEAIDAKNRELEHYLYVASHDLRTPLVNVQGFSRRLVEQVGNIDELLTQRDQKSDTPEVLFSILRTEIPQTVKFIETNIKKMDALIRGLLQISRTGRQSLHIQQIDLHALIQEILSAHAYQLIDIRATVTVKSLPKCFGDRHLLNTLFSNLIGNAIRYRHPERPLELTISATGDDEHVTCSVTDNGRGIAPEYIDRIFDAFYQIDPTQKTGGDGLGLSIVKRIVEKHRGRIRVTSEKEIRTTFFVDLPAKSFIAASDGSGQRDDESIE